MKNFSSQPQNICAQLSGNFLSIFSGFFSSICVQLMQIARNFSAFSAQFSCKFCANFAFFPRNFPEGLSSGTHACRRLSTHRKLQVLPSIKRISFSSTSSSDSSSDSSSEPAFFMQNSCTTWLPATWLEPARWLFFDATLPYSVVCLRTPANDARQSTAWLKYLAAEKTAHLDIKIYNKISSLIRVCVCVFLSSLLLFLWTFVIHKVHEDEDDDDDMHSRITCRSTLGPNLKRKLKFTCIHAPILSDVTWTSALR